MKTITFKRGEDFCGRDCPDSVGYWVGKLMDENANLETCELHFSPKGFSADQELKRQEAENKRINDLLEVIGTTIEPTDEDEPREAPFGKTEEAKPVKKPAAKKK